MWQKISRWKKNRTQRKQRAKVDPKIIGRKAHIVSRKAISPNALKVLQRLHKAGFQSYLVGGGVRDILAGVLPKDFDIATDAKPEQIKKLFRNSMIIGRRFRIVHVRFGPEIIEVTTFRGDGSDFSATKRTHRSGMLLRDNTYGSLQTDVWRRDFTLNALYYNIADFSVVDYCGGVDDIKRKRVAMIGDPAERLIEDPVRILRAIRLAAKLDFTLEPVLEAVIPQHIHRLKEVPPERLYIELIKVFYGGSGLASLPLMRKFGVFDLLFPQVAACLGEASDDVPTGLIMQALYSADKRYAEGASLSSAFLFAVLLWEPLQRQLKERLPKRTEAKDDKKRAPKGPSFGTVFDEVCNTLMQEQLKTVAIPRRVQELIVSIWAQQYRLRQRKSGQHVQHTLQHPRFRAAFDLLMLRAKAGEPVWQLAMWWDKLQSSDREGQRRMLARLTPRDDRKGQSRGGPQRREDGN